MSDPFSTFSRGPDSPVRRLRLVTPDDAHDLPVVSRLFVTLPCWITFIPVENGDDEPVTAFIDDAQIHRALPVMVRRVLTGPAGKETPADRVYAVEA